jgi:hypothetical protein
LTKFISFFARKNNRLLVVLFLTFTSLLFVPTLAKASGDLTVEVYDVLGQNNAPELPDDAVPIYQGTTDDLAHNFDEEPLGGITEDFIVRYQGVISTPEDSNVLFMAQADDGVRLYINNQLIIDDWFDKGGGGSVSAPQQFTANTPYEITLWYYENGGGAWLQTWWEVNYQWEIIPPSAFGPPAVSPTPNPSPIVPEPEPVPVEPEPTPSPEPEPTPVDEPDQESSPEPEPQPEPVEQPLPQPLPTPIPEPVVVPPIVAPEPPVVEPEPPIVIPDPLPVEPEPPVVEPEPVEEPPVPVEEPPAEAEEPPVEAEEPPIEAEEPPVEAEEPPVEEEEPPALEEEPPLVADENSTEEEKELVAEALIEAAEGEAVTAEAIAEAGLTYADLPPDTPVEVRVDANGNQVVITAEVAAALVVLESPAALVSALFTDPAQALLALGSIGADMSEEERAESQETIVAAVIVGGIATQSALTAAASVGTVAYRRNH